MHRKQTLILKTKTHILKYFIIFKCLVVLSKYLLLYFLVLLVMLGKIYSYTKKINSYTGKKLQKNLIKF